MPLLAIKECFLAKQSFDSLNHSGCIGLLDCAPDPGPFGQLDELRGDFESYDQDRNSRKESLDRACCVYPRNARHEKIQDNDVRLELLRFGDGIGPVHGGGADSPICMLFEQTVKAVTHRPAIVGYQNSSRHILAHVPTCLRVA